MGGKKQRSPQEKKALSYAKDRRNAYGENDKASRKLIPLRKEQESRQNRRKLGQELSTLPRQDDDSAALIESSARHDIHRVGGWRKGPDRTLAVAIASGLEARERRNGRKARPRNKPD